MLFLLDFNGNTFRKQRIAGVPVLLRLVTLDSLHFLFNSFNYSIRSFSSPTLSRLVNCDGSRGGPGVSHRLGLCRLSSRVSPTMIFDCRHLNCSCHTLTYYLYNRGRTVKVAHGNLESQSYCARDSVIGHTSSGVDFN